MKQEKHPRCYVVAGPNGAGKTTFALKYLPLIASCHDFVNADEIAKGLSPLDYNAGLLKASKIFLDILKQKIAMRNDFAFETTLSGRSYLPRIAEWRKFGWRVILFYLYIPNADFSAMRVQQRVLEGTISRLKILSGVIRGAYETCLNMLRSATIRCVSTIPANKSFPYLKSDSGSR